MEFVPVDMLTLRTSLLDELLLLETPLEILKERPLLVIVGLLDGGGKRELERRGDGVDPTGFRGGDCRGGPGIGKKLCLSTGEDPIGSGDVLPGHEP